MTKTTINSLRENVKGCIGHKVKIRTSRSRKKTSVKEGILEGAYPSVFTVRVKNSMGSDRAVSYSYIDLLTNTVEMTLCDEKETKIS